MAERRPRTASARRRGTGRVAIAVTAVLAAAGVLAAAPAAAAPTPSGTPSRPSAQPLARVATPDTATVTSSPGTRYARLEPACKSVRPGYAACMAVRRVTVAKGTPGAIPYARLVGSHGPAGGYSPVDLARAYQLRPSTPTRQVVAVVDAYNNPRLLHELNRFDSYYGLPIESADTFQVVNQAGGTAVLPRTDWGWAAETALDVQAVRGLCTQCKILVVEAKDASTKNLAAAENTAAQLGATIISNSYGGPEQGTSLTTQLAYRHRGVVIVAATGDDGWYGWDYVNDSPNPDPSDSMPNVPAALPSVVAVGGTTLTLTADGARASETVWNSSGLSDADAATANGASGGGCSTMFHASPWQLSVADYAKTGCGTKRMAGDVSALADPATGYSVYAPQPDGSYDSWQVIGGTSLAAPLVAAMYGLAQGGGGVAYPSQSLYLNYKYHPNWAHDVTQGGNGFCGGDTTTNCSAAVEVATTGQTGNPNMLADSNGNWLGLLDCSYSATSDVTLPNNTQCNATTGYDGPSGVGTPAGVQLLRSAFPSVQIGAPHNPGRGALRVYSALHFADTLAKATRYAWRWHDGTRPTVTTRARVTHRFATSGNHVVDLTVWDSLHRRVTVSRVIHVR